MGRSFLPNFKAPNNNAVVNRIRSDSRTLSPPLIDKSQEELHRRHASRLSIKNTHKNDDLKVENFQLEVEISQIQGRSLSSSRIQH
jgi:hypothetical protein